MTQEQIEGNKLIAEFMGGKVVDNIFVCDESTRTKNERCLHHYNVSQALYHSSWDWLMPVVKKCKETDPISYPYFYFKHALDTLRIELVWQAVVNYIEWYNKNK